MDEVFINGGAASARLYLEAANPTQQDVLDSNGGRNPRIMLPNGRRTTAVVIKPAADAFVNDEGDVTAVYTEEPLPGVCHTIAADGAGATTLHGRDSVSSTPTPGPYLAAQNLPIGSYAADGVNLATLAVERGDYSCAMVSATVDTSTGMVHDSQDGDQADLPPDVETGKGGKEPDKTTSSGNGRGKSVIEIEDWLDKHGDGYTAGTPEEERKRIRDRLQEWIEWIANYADMGSQWNADNWWKLLFRLSDAKRVWTSILERTTRRTPSNVDKRTMTKEDWKKVIAAEEAENTPTSDTEPVEEEDSPLGKVIKWWSAKQTDTVLGLLKRAQNPIGAAIDDARGFANDVKRNSHEKDMFGDDVGVVGGIGVSILERLGVREMGDGAEKVQDAANIGESEATDWSGVVDGATEFADGAEKYTNAVCAVAGAATMARGMCFVEGTGILALSDGISADAANRILQQGGDAGAVCMVRPIETIRAGDWVLSRMDGRPEAPLVFRQVEQTFVHEVQELVDVTVFDAFGGRSGTVRATIGHPFWVSTTHGSAAPIADAGAPHFGTSVTYRLDANDHVVHSEEGWVFATDLKAGYTLATSSGDRRDVAHTRYFECRTTKVYNLRVAETHTYFVAPSDNCYEGLWVHNSNAKSPGGCRKQVYKKYDTRKQAKDARPRPKPMPPKGTKGRPPHTRQGKNKIGMGNQGGERHNKGPRHFHDDRHNDRNASNNHYQAVEIAVSTGLLLRFFGPSG